MHVKILRSLVLWGLLAALFVSGCTSEKAVNMPQTQKEKISYAVGRDLGQDVKAQSLDLNHDLLLQGMRDALSGKEPLISKEEMTKIRESFVKERQAALQQKRQEIAAGNLKEEQDFLAEGKKKEGVVTLESGLQYRVITPGDGAKPQLEDNVKVHYRGYFVDGSEFENSYQADQPTVFPVRGVIPGWTEALQLMPEGSKWELFVPSALAYGNKGAGAKIGPNRMLVFEIELIGIH